MKCAFSFSLYNSNNYWGGNVYKYTYNCVANVLISNVLFPEWMIYVYYDDTIQHDIINFLKKSKNVVAIDMTNHWLSKKDKMMWRNLILDQPNLDIVCIRDCDTWLTKREKDIIYEWINSDKTLHIIRDHCYHNLKMMGGMWGIKIKQNKLDKMENLLSNYFTSSINHITHSGQDQKFLETYYYNSFIEDTMIHIGEQYNNNGVPIYKTGGYYPNEKCIKKIPLFNKDQDCLIPELSFFKTSIINQFYCEHCKSQNHFYIGSMFNKLSPETILFINNKIKNSK